MAIAPSALMDLFVVPDSRANEPHGAQSEIAVVDICGPLTHHTDYWSDSYDDTRARVQLACADAKCKAIVLRVNSPGGEASGCFQAARDIRAACLAARKPIYAFIENASSAGYALASAAASITLADTAVVGSIGILYARQDISAQNAARGVRVALITSGARKADGYVDNPITDAELAETQAIIDSTARVFFQLVADMRHIPPDRVAAMQGRSFHGQAAISAGLADQVGSFDSLLARIAGALSKGTVAMSDYERAKELLEKAAAGEDANAAAAKRALAALTAGDPDAEPTEETTEPAAAAASEDEPVAAAADDEPVAAAGGDEPADDTKKKAPTAQSANAIALQALSEVHKLRAEQARAAETGERNTLLASRPDFAPELRKILKTADMATVRTMVKTLPRGPVSKPAASAAVSGIRGEGQGGSGGAGPARTAEAASMGARMGVGATTLGVRKEGHSLVFGVTNAAPAAAAAVSGKDGAK
jgi:ClpP class serine protease